MSDPLTASSHPLIVRPCGATRLAVVLGWPIEHSRSPAMMKAAFAALGIDAMMLPVAVPPDRVDAAIAELRTLPMLGASVTIPHKQQISSLVDELTATAAAIGAVNCLQLDDARIIGHNTDAPAFLDGLLAAGFAPGGKRVVLLGAGGAARAVAYGLREHAQTLDVVAREPARVDWIGALPWTDAQLRECFARADLVVDCTPAGLDDAADAELAASLPLAELAPDAWVATLVYHRRTLVLERASARGHSTLDGRAMLVHQGARAFTIWTGEPAPIDVMTRALDASL